MARTPDQAPREESRDDDLVTLADAIDFLRRHLLLLLLTPLIAAVAAILILKLLIPRQYEASVTLVVVPQTFASELKPPELPVPGYQSLLESTTVIANMIRRLQAEQVLLADETLRLGEELESRVSLTRRGPEAPLAPTIDAVARGRTGRQAAAIANAWAEVFLEQARLLQSNTISPTIAFIEEEYKKERETLEGLEQERLDTANKYQRLIDQAASRLDRKLVDHKNETESLISGYHSETRRLMEELANREVFDPGDQKVHEELHRKLVQVLALRAQLAQTPRILTLQKAISDDALWQTLALGQEGGFDPRQTSELSLRSEQVNVVYDDLVRQLSQIQIDLDRLPAQELIAVQKFMMDVEELQVNRTAGLSKLVSERALGLEDLKRKRAQELDALEREQEMRLARLELDIAIEHEYYEKLSRSNDEANLARAEKDILEVRLGTPAVAPVEAEPRPIALIALAAAAAGALIGLLVSLVREVSA